MSAASARAELLPDARQSLARSRRLSFGPAGAVNEALEAYLESKSVWISLE